MNRAEKTDPQIQQEFTHQAIKRHLAKYPQCAHEIVLQLLTKLKEQRQQQYDLEQKYDALLTSYLEINDIYLATLQLLSDCNPPQQI